MSNSSSEEYAILPGSTQSVLSTSTSLARFAADRLDHVANVIRPALEDGVHVVTDRYLASALAYQGANLGFDTVNVMNQRCALPDLTLFLDVPVQVCRSRLRGERWHPDLYPDLYDQSDQLNEVREKFIEVLHQLQSEGQQVAIINGDQSPNVVHKEVQRVVAKLLGRGRSRKARRARLETARTTTTA